MAARRRLASVPITQSERLPDLRDAVAASVDAMDWLTPTDHAMKTLALRQAEEIQTAADRADEAAAIAASAEGKHDVYARLRRLEAMCDVTKTVARLGPQLQRVLRDLGGTPASRAAMRRDKPVGSRLAQLREAARQYDTTDFDPASGRGPSRSVWFRLRVDAGELAGVFGGRLRRERARPQAGAAAALAADPRAGAAPYSFG